MPVKKARKTSSAKPAGVLSKVKPVAKLERAISALFYGRSGSGKTTLSATFPKPLLLININENGTDSIHDEEGVFVLDLENWDQFEEIYWALESGDTEYKSVVIDAAHTLQDCAIDKVKKDANKEEGEQTSKRDFGLASGILKSWILNYIDLSTKGINVVFLAHDRITEVDVDEGDDAIMPEVGPRMMPSVGSTLTGSVNVVGYNFVKESISKPKKVGEKREKKIEYCLRIGPHGYYTTKVRKPKAQILPELLINPDYNSILSIVRGTYQPPVKKQADPKTTKKSSTRRKASTK
jgi:hypothetical protein